MVLAELGTKLQTALSKLNRTTVVDDEVFNTILKEICGALLESDVQVKLVRELRDGVKLAVSLQDDNTSGLNRRRLIQKSVVDQLIRMLEPEAKPYKFKKGTSNVVMFVGLQVQFCAAVTMALWGNLCAWTIGRDANVYCVDVYTHLC